MIWCSPDKVKAWDAFFASGTLPDNAGECDNPVDEDECAGQKLRVQATPTLIFANGSIVPGAIAPEQMEVEFKKRGGGRDRQETGGGAQVTSIHVADPAPASARRKDTRWP